MNILSIIKNNFKNIQEFNSLIIEIKEKGNVFTHELNSINDLNDIIYRLMYLKPVLDYNVYCSTVSYNNMQKIINDFSFVKNTPIQIKTVLIMGVKLNIIHLPETKNIVFVPNLEHINPKQCATNI